MTRWFKHVLTVALMVGLVALPAPPAQAGDNYMPRPGAYFNMARSSIKEERRIHVPIIGAINHAKRGSTIRFLVYSYDRQYITDALIRAYRRGVHVQILLNDHQYTGAMVRLRNVIGANRSKRSFIYRCKESCRGPAGTAQHTKFYLFTETGKAHHTVMLGSANLTLNATHNQYNDIWVRNNDEEMHGVFKELFDQARKDKKAHPIFWQRTIHEEFELSVFPHPWRTESNDVIMQYLNKVECHGADPSVGNGNGRTVVRVLVHVWNGSRGEYLAKKVRQLYAQGCDVKILYGFVGSLVRQVFRNRTDRGYIQARTTGFDTDEDMILDLYTHQKELLISGNYDGDPAAKIVVTGSSNWSNAGATGDEIIWWMKKPAALDAYMANFNTLWNRRSKKAYYLPGRGELLRHGDAWEAD